MLVCSFNLRIPCLITESQSVVVGQSRYQELWWNLASKGEPHRRHTHLLCQPWMSSGSLSRDSFVNVCPLAKRISLPFRKMMLSSDVIFLNWNTLFHHPLHTCFFPSFGLCTSHISILQKPQDILPLRFCDRFHELNFNRCPKGERHGSPSVDSVAEASRSFKKTSCPGCLMHSKPQMEVLGCDFTCVFEHFQHENLRNWVLVNANET